MHWSNEFFRSINNVLLEQTPVCAAGFRKKSAQTWIAHERIWKCVCNLFTIWNDVKSHVSSSSSAPVHSVIVHFERRKKNSTQLYNVIQIVVNALSWERDRKKNGTTNANQSRQCVEIMSSCISILSITFASHAKSFPCRS